MMADWLAPLTTWPPVNNEIGRARETNEGVEAGAESRSK
jgi:hypothetical protein